MPNIAQLESICTNATGSAGAWTFTFAFPTDAASAAKPHQLTGTLTYTSTMQKQEFLKGVRYTWAVRAQGDFESPIVD